MTAELLASPGPTKKPTAVLSCRDTRSGVKNDAGTPQKVETCLGDVLMISTEEMEPKSTLYLLCINIFVFAHILS